MGVSSSLVALVLATFGSLDILVLNHIKSVYEPILPPDAEPGTEAYRKASEKMVRESEEVLRVNTVAYIELTMSALPHLRTSTLSHGGSWTSQVLVCSSGSALMAAPNVHSYASSTAALNTWFLDLRTELMCNRFYNGIITISTVIMGAIASEGFLATPLVGNERVMGMVKSTSETAWRVILSGFEKGRGRNVFFPFCKFLCKLDFRSRNEG